MHPVFLNVGPLTIHWFGVCMALGFLAALYNWSRLARREGRDLAYCSDLLFWIVISGILGARVAYVVADWSYFRGNPVQILRIDQGGLIYYGGFLASAAAVVLFARLHKQSLLSLMDFVATSIPLAHAFGRLGCFMNGCCHGAVYSGPLAVTYPGYPYISAAWLAQYDAHLLANGTLRSLPVHPVQLYEAAYNLLVFAVVLAVYRRRRREGEVAGVYLVLYPVGRFLFEFLRGDSRMQCLGLNVAQLVSLGLFASGLALLLWTRRAGAKPR